MKLKNMVNSRGGLLYAKNQEWVNNLLKIFQRTNLFNYSANINEKPQ